MSKKAFLQESKVNSSIISSTNPIPEFFTGRQIKSIIFDRTGSKIIDQELSDFTRSFYHRLAEANLKRETFEREQDNRRLDAMARLLVGDETCAAVAFDDHNLLIANNENTHSKDRINIKINVIFTPDKYAVDTYQVYPVVYLSYNDSLPTRFVSKQPLEYYYRKRDNSLQLSRDSSTDLVINLTPAEHLIPFLSDFPVGIKGVCSQSIPFPNLQHYEGFKNEVNTLNEGVNGGKGVESDTKFNFSTAENALQRRAEVLVDHLATVSLFALNEDQMSESDLQKYSSVADHTRQRVLMNSLSWEASIWYKDAFHPRGYIDSRKVGIDKFLEVLNNDFSLYKAQHFQDQGKVALVRGWFEQVALKVDSGDIEAPNYIKQNIPSFIKKAESYFIDLTKLEDFFKREILSDSPIASLFLNQGRPYTAKSCIKIIDDLEDGVHAEIRVLDYLLKNKLHVNYIATSFLCCAHCKLFMDSYKIDNISGIHARAYDRWLLPEVFKTNQDFLRAFFGDELYAKFSNLTLIESRFDHKIVTKSELAFKIVQGIASLDTKYFPILKISVGKLWNNERMRADESDDEYDTESIELRETAVSLSLPYPFDFDITGIVPSYNDNPCLAPRNFIGDLDQLPDSLDL